MSAQRLSIPLHHAPDDKGYRLIELPPELQSLLESDDAPALTLESSDPSALLKSPKGVYSLRQKNTSNSVILLSCRAPPTNLDGGDSSSNGAIEFAAIATIKETVELHPLPKDHAGNAQNPLPTETKSKGKWHERFGSSR